MVAGLLVVLGLGLGVAAVAIWGLNRGSHFGFEAVWPLWLWTVVLAVALYWVVNRTKLGMMIRAGASNRDMVRGLGIDIQRLYRIVFAGGVALAALAGMIAAPLSSVYPNMGGSVLIICFVVVVIGGIGSIKGALVAALLIGFVDTFGKVLWQEGAGALVYVLMAGILLWRPAGLFKAG